MTVITDTVRSCAPCSNVAPSLRVDGDLTLFEMKSGFARIEKKKITFSNHVIQILATQEKRTLDYQADDCLQGYIRLYRYMSSRLIMPSPRHR